MLVKWKLSLCACAFLVLCLPGWGYPQNIRDIFLQVSLIFFGLWFSSTVKGEN